MTATVTLANGVEVPQLGFGVFQIPPHGAQAAVESALEAGYRHIDTAAAYNNEAGVGAALTATGIPRDEVFLTTKLRNGDQGRDSTRRAFDDSRTALGVDVVDLYLIHWPSPARGLFPESWDVLCALEDEGAARAVGVSNFLPHHLEQLRSSSGVAPTVNQIELHPTFQQPEVVRACAAAGIAIEAYSPLGQGGDLDASEVHDVAERIGATPAQVVLAWHLALGRIVIPKSVRPERMVENLAATSVQLDADDLARISSLDANQRIGGDPQYFEISQIR